MRAKAALRAELRAQRHRLSSTERSELARRAGEHLLSLPALRGIRRVALYAHFDGELPSDAVFRALRQRGTDVVYPRVEQPKGRLAFASVSDLSSLAPGTFQVLEPSGPAVPLDEIDVVIVPGLAFDIQGVRLGYGAGYYDRTLAGYAGVSIGLGYCFQIVESLPRAPHDQLLDYLVCETGVIVCGAPDAGGGLGGRP